MHHLFWSILTLLLLNMSTHALTVVTTIKPLGSIAMSLTEGTEHSVHSLYDGKTSPHTTLLKMSDVTLLKKADLVLWVGPEYEMGAQKYTHIAEDHKLLTTTKMEGMRLLSTRFGHTCREHTHDHTPECDHGEADENKVQKDGHVWMDPKNAIVILKNVCAKLIALDPSSRAIFEKNLKVTIREIEDFHTQWKEHIQTLSPPPYITFHDFTRYLDEAFGTKCVGVIAPNFHGGGLSIKHMQALSSLVQQYNIHTFVTEPQFPQSQIKGSLQKILPSKVTPKVISLDYLGGEKMLSKNLFLDVLKDLLSALGDELSI